MKQVIFVLDEGNSIRRQFKVQTKHYHAPAVKSLVSKDNLGLVHRDDLKQINNWPGQEYNVVTVTSGEITIIAVLQISSSLSRRIDFGLPTMPIEYYQEMIN